MTDSWTPGAPAAPASFEEISRLIDTVPGFLLKEQERYLFDKVRSLPDGAVILEFGRKLIRSTAVLAFACKGTRKHVYSLDTWITGTGSGAHGDGFPEEWKGHLDRLGLSSHATLLRGFPAAVLPDKAGFPDPDLVFIDVAHEFVDVLEDFRLIHPRVKDGGWIAFHDVEAGWPGPWRAWKDYGAHVLADHEICSTMACGRKIAARPFGRRPGSEALFPYARELAREYSARYGSSHPLVQAMETSLAGRWGTQEEKLATAKAEQRLGQAPERDFHAVLKDLIEARDGRVDGHIRLWSGLSLLAQGKVPEAVAHLEAASKVSSALSADRTGLWLQAVGTPGSASGANAPSPFQSHIRASDTVLALGSGDGAVLAGLACANKVGMEADPEARRLSVNERGIDAAADWGDLPEACADVLISDHGLSRDGAPLLTLREAHGRLKRGGKAVILEGAGSGTAGTYFCWTPESLGNLLEAAGFEVQSVDAMGPVLQAVASRR